MSKLVKLIGVRYDSLSVVKRVLYSQYELSALRSNQVLLSTWVDMLEVKLCCVVVPYTKDLLRLEVVEYKDFNLEYWFDKSELFTNNELLFTFENCWILLNESVAFKVFVPTELVSINFSIFEFIEGDKRTLVGVEDELLSSADW